MNNNLTNTDSVRWWKVGTTRTESESLDKKVNRKTESHLICRTIVWITRLFLAVLDLRRCWLTGVRQASQLPSTTAVDVNELERMRDKEEGVFLPPGYRVEILERTSRNISSASPEGWKHTLWNVCVSFLLKISFSFSPTELRAEVGLKRKRMFHLRQRVLFLLKL